MLKQPPLEHFVFHDFSDLLYLAWRGQFVCGEADVPFIHSRDAILEEIAKTEERRRQLFDAEEQEDTSLNELDSLQDKQSNLINLLYSPYYGGDPNPENYDELIYSLSEIADGLGWDTALKEIYERHPDRLERRLETRGRHWKRKHYFSMAKSYCEPFFRWLITTDRQGNRMTPFESLGFNKIEFGSNDSLRQAHNCSVNPPSDEMIFQTFLDIFDDKSHRHNTLFTAVNNQTDLRLLGSLKALERSLAKGRQQR